jgi:spore coat protein CotH
MNSLLLKSGTLLVALLIFSGCEKEIFVLSGTGLDDWSTETHSSSINPNYDVVFNNDQVNRIDMVFTENDWETMQEDLEDVLSSSSGSGSFSEQTPLYFPCDFYFNGIQWYEVGVRYKGNSSLQSSYQQNIGKLPFRLNFDEFEDDYPEITDQRFYGFKELSLGNNFDDESLMREKSASDLFRNFGVPATRTAFYEIYVDKGGGAEYFGVYTMTEIVFDTFLKDYFGSESGNCYKPEDDGAQFAASSFNLEDFELKTNEYSADKSDIQALYNALHSSNRTANSTQWKADLEAVFDVDGFLKYLAVNNTIQNWDTYGNMSHNYYLYHDPADDLIKWIVWDNNEAFSSGKGRNGALSFGMSEVGSDWPLISYLIADQTYLDTYKSYISSFISSSFEYNRMSTIYSDQESLLYNSAANEESGYTFLSNVGSFTSAVSTLKSHCSSRISSADAYVQ